MAAMEVRGDHVGDRVLAVEQADLGPDVGEPARLTPVASVHEHRRLDGNFAAAFRSLDVGDDQRLAKPVLSDVLGKLLELVFGHHREDVGGREYR
jgi:hypothetical protein